MPKDVAKLNRDIRKEALREELRSREYIRQVERILDKDYMQIDQDVSEKDTAEEKAAKMMTAAGGRDTAIREANMKLGGYFKLLNKTLPDLKAVEVTGKDGEKLMPDVIRVVHE